MSVQFASYRRMQTVKQHDLAESTSLVASPDSESKRRSLSPRARCLRRRAGSGIGGGLLFVASQHNLQGTLA